jgi:hypothetical protein
VGFRFSIYNSLPTDRAQLPVSSVALSKNRPGLTEKLTEMQLCLSRDIRAHDTLLVHTFTRNIR